MGSSNKEVAPCLFCSNTDLELITRDDEKSFVHCPECDGTGPTTDGTNEAIRRWNKRLVIGLPEDMVKNVEESLSLFEVEDMAKKIAAEKKRMTSDG